MPQDDKTRQLIVAKLDPSHYYGEIEAVEQFASVGGGQFTGLCPFHDDHTPSLSIGPTGVFYCFTCKAAGSVFDFYMRRHLTQQLETEEGRKAAYLEARRVLAEYAGVSLQGGENLEPLPVQEIEKWQEDLTKNKQTMTFLREERGYTDETIKKWRLGWNGERITIPIFDLDSNLVNVRMYLPHAKGRKQKMVGKQGYNRARLFPVKNLEKSEEIILAEGETDTILLNQEGFNAMTVTSGSGTWNPEWTKLFHGKRVVLCQDNDLAGREGSARLALLLSKVATVYIVKWPSNLPEKGDVTDYFVNLGHTRDDFQQLVLDAPMYVPPAGQQQKQLGPATEVSLQASTQAKFVGQRIRVKAFVNGKEMAPYVCPKVIEFTCAGRGDKSCEGCPSFGEGKVTLALDAAEQGVLSLIDCNDVDQRKILKTALGVQTSCPTVKMEIKEPMNIEVLNLIPELDSAPTGVDDEYVTRQVYAITHGVRTNRAYVLEGVLWPHPKNQQATHLLDVIKPAQDSLSEYKLTEEWRDQLTELFQPKGNAIQEKLQDIYGDFASNVHRIRGRFNAQIAFDLVWHSVLAFYFNGAYVRKGWVEGLVLGDSGQGKSEMANGLLRHYRMGDRIQGEVTSGAGLVGGLEKMGEHWILRWGKIPQNDRRLLIIDEFGGIPEEEVAKMSDLRSTGIAEVVKIRIERANARTRLIFMSNPREGMPLSAYDQGILAVKRLFSKMEDVRRLDYAMLVASGEVDPHIINQLYTESSPHKYTSEACRQLVLWAWSMDHAAVKFSAAATKTILAAASDMGDRYSSKIPIVEPADQRLKLARLSVALAARLFSTPDGIELHVNQDHVEWVVAWLHSIYSNQYMAYHEYSKFQKDSERVLNGDERLTVINELAKLPNILDLVGHLSGQAYAFKKPDLADQLGYDAEQARVVLKTLSKLGLIRTTARGYSKQPQFIKLLRELSTPQGQQLLQNGHQPEKEPDF